MKKVILVILSFIAMVPSVLVARDNEPQQGRKKVGVVLSGGGAKGVAHVSALKAIEEAGIPIDYIAGTSMGAIVAGLYAIGYDTNVLDSLFRSQDWDFLIYDKVSRSNLTFREKDSDEKYMLTMRLTQDRKFKLPSGLIGGYNIYNLLYELTIGYHEEMSFNDLPIPFACMGYDMVTGEAVTLDSGYLPDAIRASMSIPGAFECVEIGDMVLVDGGIGNNFPVDVIRKMGAEIVIGIDVTSPLKTKEELTSFAAIFDQITSFTALQSYRENMEQVDFYVHPDITGFTAASFSAPAIDTLLARGAAAMEEKKGELYALKSKIGIADSFVPERVKPVEINPPIQINSIYFEGLSADDDSALRRIIRLKEGSTLSGTDLQDAVAILMGTGSFSDARYRLDGHKPYDLTFILTEKSKNSASLGFRFDSEEMAAVLLNVNLAGRNMTNSRFEVTAKLGNNPYVQGGYTIGGVASERFSVSYKFRYYDMSLYVRGKKMSNLDFNHHRVDVNFSNLRIRNFMVTAGISYDYYHYRSIIANVENTGDVFSQGLFSYYISTDYETLDSKYYPTRGSSFTMRSQLYTNNFIGYKGGAPFFSAQLDYYTVITPGKRISLIPGVFGRVLAGNDFAYPANNFFGGTQPGRYVPQQIPFIGVHYIEPLRRSVAGVKLDLRYRVAANNYFSVLTNFAMHNNNFFELLEGEAMFGFGVKYSYNSVIGPLDIMLDYSTYDEKAGIFLNVGYFF